MIWGFGWGFMFIGPICMILIGVAVYFAFFHSSRHSNHVHHYNRQQYPTQTRAIDTLNERYARGEITKEQYLQMRKTIEENH